ncbi:TetR/AcrR family transcriptional regulator [Mycobacterium arosiense]|uniref:HTH tetR-type domain-containing protein n=1 Tax=Mycobacterium arosiense ATCC BAA-1401 = DSM 45069 TaxID=1265311 RepID=A0A1W9Z5S9_MYCAI|nr:helix-turn-helix domain-containing protein [Mycobacterium arosiense]ORA07669.1 hypothetical protein BST14_26805 [Mycobacterium arosiense ATCC BAA-1401 = DSM 45069]
MVRTAPSGETPKQARRAPGVARELLLAAAHDEFDDHGYARASTRAIAERAGVAEPLIFRHFGSKAGLFNEVVFGPIRIFMQGWEEFNTKAGTKYDPETLAKKFVGGLYDLLRANRGLMVTYFATHVFEPELFDEFGTVSGFLDVIQLMDRETEKRIAVEKQLRRPTKVSAKTRLHERISVGSVIAAALFDDLLFQGMSTMPTRNQLVNELARIAITSQPDLRG